MREHGAIRETLPEEKIERRRVAPEALRHIPDAPPQETAEPKTTIGLIEAPVMQGELPPFQESFADDEPTFSGVSILDQEEDPAPKGFMQKIAASRWAKMIGIAGLFGASIEAANAFQDANERRETREEIAATVHGIALESRLDHALEQIAIASELPRSTDIITLAEDGRSLTRSERLHELNTEYTENAKSAGLFNYLKDQCSPDAKTLSMEECVAKYGDQLKLSPEGVAALAEATGYSPEELSLHGETIRQSVVIRGDAFGGVAPMGRYHADELASTYGHERSALYNDHYEQASQLIHTAVRALDLTHASAAAQQEAVTTLAHVIRSEIDLTNSLTRVANDIEHLSSPEAQQSLLDGLPTAEGEKMSDISRLDLAEFQATSGWTKLMTLEANANGPLHELGEKMEYERTMQRQELFTQGRQLDILPSFFAEQTKTTE